MRIEMEETSRPRERDTGPSRLGMMVGIPILVFIMVSLALSAPDSDAPLAPWVAAVAGLPFLTMPIRRFGRLWSSYGAYFAAVWIGVLLAATGGTGSPFIYLYVILLVLSALRVTGGQLAVTAMLVILGALSPLLYDASADAEFISDVAFNASIAVGAAIAIHLLVTRLAASEEQFRLLAENAQDVVYRMEVPEKLTYVSPAVTALTGYEPAELYADPGLWPMLVDPRDRATVSDAVRAAGTGPTTVTLRIHHRHGEVRWVEDRFAVVDRDGQGQPAVREGHFRDVTDRVLVEQQLQANEAQFRSLAQQTSDIIYRYRVRPQPRFEFINEVVETVTGFPPERFFEDPGLVWERMDPDDRQEHRRVRRDLDRIHEPFVARWQRADGEWVWLEERLRPVYDENGQVEVVNGSIRDITLQKHAEERLMAALEREREAADRLREVDQLKNSFLQAVSHELRTPLTSLVGYAETMKAYGTSLTGEQGALMVDRLVANATKLQRLLTNLLDVDRLSRGDVTAVRLPTDLVQLVERIAAEYERAHVDLRLTADLDEVTIDIDAPKVERIIENLLGNAIKHTPDGTPVHLRLRADNGAAHLVVEDHGPGVPDDLKEQIFEPFRQGPQSAGQASPGTGIGLALVGQLAELHGGRAWVEDRPGGGSAFHVLLPGGETAAESGDAHVSSGGPTPG